MKPGSSRTKIAFLALGLGLAMALAAGQGETRGADGPALVIGEGGCSFSPQIQRVPASLPGYSDMQMHADRRTARFAFEDLHGVGVAESWDAEWSEVRLYFREDLPALKATLERIGLRDGALAIVCQGPSR